MTALLGNTEARVVYKNFQLENLTTNNPDYSHENYQKYLQYNKFVPPREKKYFAHTVNNIVPTPPVKDVSKGLFNLFPLDLTSDQFNNTHSTSLGKSPFPH